MAGIKESVELLDGLEMVAVSGIKMYKNGLNMGLLPIGFELIKGYSVLVEAIKGSDQIVAEAKDLDMLEIGVLVAKLKSIADNVKEAYA